MGRLGVCLADSDAETHAPHLWHGSHDRWSRGAEFLGGGEGWVLESRVVMGVMGVMDHLGVDGMDGMLSSCNI